MEHCSVGRSTERKVCLSAPPPAASPTPQQTVHVPGCPGRAYDAAHLLSHRLHHRNTSLGDMSPGPRH